MRNKTRIRHTDLRLFKLVWAENELKRLRDHITRQIAPGSAGKIRSALKSIQGAIRNAQRFATGSAENQRHGRWRNRKGAANDSLQPAADALPRPSLLAQVQAYIRASKAENTLRGYQTDWDNFCTWCRWHNVSPLPAAPEAVAVYIAESAERLKPGSMGD